MSKYHDPGQLPLGEFNGVFTAHPDLASFARGILGDGGDITRRLVMADFIQDKQDVFPNAGELAPLLRDDGRWVILFNGNDRRPFLAWQPRNDVLVIIAELTAAACPACADCGSSPKFERPENYPLERNLEHVDALEWRSWRFNHNAERGVKQLEVPPAWRCRHMCWRDTSLFVREEAELPDDPDAHDAEQSYLNPENAPRG